MGSTSSPYSCSLTRDPSTATLAADVTSSAVKNDPYFIDHDRMSGRSMSVPSTRVPQLAFPLINWVRVDTPGETYCTPGTLRTALASSSVSRVEEPWPMRTPPWLKLPALIMIMLVPADLICSSIEDWAPVPSATMAITAPTPMIMPSMVSEVRILLRLSALIAIRSVINRDMGVSPR